MSEREIQFDAELTAFGTVSLGGLIDAIKPLQLRPDHEPGDYLSPDRWVQFDFCGFSPAGIHSYRGYYDHLALGIQTGHSDHKVVALLALLKEAVGNTYGGWKGGEFKMNRKTPVWVSPAGESHGTAIVGMLVESCVITLITEYIP